MYRSVTFAALRRGVDPSEAEQVARIVEDIELEVRVDGVTVDGVDATIEIRGPEVSRAVSIVAANPAVRAEMVRRQREWVAARDGGVLEGRDIGTVVFPDAELKVYLTADPEVRAQRRSQEVTDLDYETVAADLARRDALDQGRDVSPLTEAARRLPARHHRDDRGGDRRHDRRRSWGTGGSMAEARPGRRRRDLDRPAEPRARASPTRSSAASSSSWPSCSVASRSSARRRSPPRARTSWRRCTAATSTSPSPSIVTRRPMRYMGKDSIWKSKPLGRFVSMLGAFPVHRGSADRDALKACTDIVNGGSPLVMFPEGTRQSGPIVQEMFDGTAYVAAKTDVPIIPMGIGGSEAMMPKGAKLLKPSKLVLIVGDPIPPPERTRAGSHAAQRGRRAHRAAPRRDPGALRRGPGRAGQPNPTRRRRPTDRLRRPWWRSAPRCRCARDLGRREHLAHALLEVLEGERVVVGVEGLLVPVVGELLGELRTRRR